MTGIFDVYLAKNAGEEPSHGCPADENLQMSQHNHLVENIDARTPLR